MRFAAVSALILLPFFAGRAAETPKTAEVRFTSHDGYEMFGKLTTPAAGKPRAVVIYVQTAEGMTADMKRRGAAGPFNYFDLYRDKLPAINVAFFGYEGRGIRMGPDPPRYETIDRAIYNTSTLDNKVRDVLSAAAAVKKQPGMSAVPVFLMGASEGTLIAVEAASRAPREIAAVIGYAVMSANMREIFRYIMTDGAFLNYRGYFDTDKDGKISKAEFEADPMKYRQNVWKNAGFEVFDRNGDGFFTASEMPPLTKMYTDAIDQDNFEVLDRWAKTSAAVATPDGWFKDHFAHPPIWTFLSKLDIPVGLFQGDADPMVSAAGVRKLEQQAKAAGKTRIEFHFFPGLEHTLGVGAYFASGTVPAGHQAVFEYIRKLAESR